MTARSAGKKNKATPKERAMLQRLREVRRQRAPFEHLSRSIISENLARFLPSSGSIAEIGTGDGQLRERLPESVLPRVIHTEPEAVAIRAFRKCQPDVGVVRASAEQLPCQDGELSAVLGLCVLDVVADGPRVARELARVLRPGGVLIHWLDMSTRLNEVFSDLASSSLVPIPNVFSDPTAARWPEDLFLVPRHELAVVLEVLARHRHPLARPLRQYLAVFAAQPFPIRAAVAEFVTLLESAELRRALQSMFKAALALAPAELRPRLADFQGRPVSSARHLESRLKSWFAAELGFRIEFSDIVAGFELVERDAEHSLPYMSSCVGEQRQLPTMPDTLLRSDAKLPAEQQTLLELGMFVFVVTRN